MWSTIRDSEHWMGSVERVYEESGKHVSKELSWQSPPVRSTSVMGTLDIIVLLHAWYAYFSEICCPWNGGSNRIYVVRTFFAYKWFLWFLLKICDLIADGMGRVVCITVLVFFQCLLSFDLPVCRRSLKFLMTRPCNLIIREIWGVRHAQFQSISKSSIIALPQSNRYLSHTCSLVSLLIVPVKCILL